MWAGRCCWDGWEIAIWLKARGWRTVLRGSEEAHQTSHLLTVPRGSEVTRPCVLRDHFSRAPRKDGFYPGEAAEEREVFTLVCGWLAGRLWTRHLSSLHSEGEWTVLFLGLSTSHLLDQIQARSIPKAQKESMKQAVQRKLTLTIKGWGREWGACEKEPNLGGGGSLFKPQ